MKNNLLRNILVLAGICSFFALVLGLVNLFTAPVIAENRARREKGALAAVVPEGHVVGDRIVVDGDPVVRGYNPVVEGSHVRYVILILQTDGYGGPLTLLGEYSPEGSLVRALAGDHAETPGFGKKIEESWYMGLFTGKGGEQPLPSSRNQLPADKADSVSGATITFTAVSSAFLAGSEWVKKHPEAFQP